MEAPSHVPAGFCPRCGYPIDPGRCSECGTDVSSEKLARVDPRITRRKLRRRGIAALALLAIGIAAVKAPWLEIAPTSLLLFLQKPRYNAVAKELERREALSLLTAEQDNRCAAQSFFVEPRLDVVSPYPAGIRVRTAMLCSDSLMRYFGCRFDDVVVRIDGVVFDSYPALLIPNLKGSPRTFEASCLLPPLLPGRHRIEVSGVITKTVPPWFRSGVTARAAAQADPPQREFTASTDVLIVDKPLEEIVPLSFKANPHTPGAAPFTVVVGRVKDGLNSVRLQICTGELSVAIAARTEYRLKGEAGWRDLQQSVRIAPRSGVPLEVRWVTLPLPENAQADELVFSFRLVPDLKAMVEQGELDSFGGRIEWDDLRPAASSNEGLGCTGGRPPTRIVPLRWQGDR